MKNLKTAIFYLLALFFAYSCQDEITDPRLDSKDVVNPVMKYPVAGKVYKFTASNTNDTILFKFSLAEFPISVANDYVIQAAVAGTNFAKTVDIGAAAKSPASLKYGDINQALQPLLGNPASFNAKDFEFRVSARLSPFTNLYASAPVKVNIATYDVSEVAFALWCPGNYQAASGYGSDWTPSAAPKVYSPDNDKKYQGYIYFKGSNVEFKFTGQPDWNPDNWGNDKKSELKGNLIKGGDNILLPAEGYYQVNADIKALTFELIKTEWGIIGDATPGGWDGSTPMTYDKATKLWTWSGNLTAASLKFRANNAWDINYGGQKGDNDPANFPSGTCKAGGGNIKVTSAGTYTVTLDLSKQPYKYKIEAKATMNMMDRKWGYTKQPFK